MNTKYVLAVSLLICLTPIIGRAQLVGYNFEDATFAPSNVYFGVDASNLSLDSGGALSLGAGSASSFNGPRGFAAVGNDFVDEGAFIFTVAPLGGASLHITGLGFGSLKEGMSAKGAKLYYKAGNNPRVFISQFDDFVSPPVQNFDAGALGFFYNGYQKLDLTFASSVEFMITQEGLPTG